MNVVIKAQVSVFPYNDGGQAVYILGVLVPIGQPRPEVILTVSDCQEKGIEAKFPLYQRDGVIK